MSYPNDVDRLVSTTLKHYRRQLMDNLTYSQILLDAIRRSGGVRIIPGGTNIVEHILYAQNPSVDTYYGFDPLNNQPSEGITLAEFNWKQMSGLAQWSGLEQFMNSSNTERLISLSEAITEQLEISFGMVLSQMLFGDGTGNSGKDWLGLAALIENGAAWSTIGTIDSNIYTWWRNVWSGNVGPFASNGMAAIRTATNDCSRGNQRINLIISDQDAYEAYEKLLVQQLMITDKTQGDIGFPILKYKGISWGFDDDCDDGTVIGMNTNFIHLNFGKGREMASTEVMHPFDQDASMIRSFMYGNMSVNVRKMHFRVDGLTF